MADTTDSGARNQHLRREPGLLFGLTIRAGRDPSGLDRPPGIRMRMLEKFGRDLGLWFIDRHKLPADHRREVPSCS